MKLCHVRLKLAVALALRGVVPVWSQTEGPTAGFEAFPRVEARLSIGDSIRDVELTGRSPTAVGIVEQTLTGSRREGLVAISDIQAVFFRFEIDWRALRAAWQNQEWEQAVLLTAGPLTPFKPYLALPNNNVAELVLQTGDYMMRAAEMQRLNGETEKAREQFRAAFNWFRELITVDWSPVGLLARLKRIRCLLALGRADWAREYIGQIAQPVPGDRAYGLYWLVMADIEVEGGDFRKGIEYAVKSVAFETKDIDTFPDALMLTARCYEELQEWHRARDVYFEIATIFPNTDWQEIAVRRLQLIRRNKLTETEDVQPIESVFFHLKEDMNALVDELFVKIEERKNRKTEIRVIESSTPRVEVSERQEPDAERVPVSFDEVDLK